MEKELVLKFTSDEDREKFMQEWDELLDEVPYNLITPIMEVNPVNKTISKLCEEAFETAKSKGWHDKPRSFGEFISLVHAEVSKALEADRRNEGKERVAEELGDVLIRIFDGTIEFGLDVETAILTKMAFNKTRSYKHGNKKY
jgi:NTP pyrophosphatase (non-canonical NTP hydrolase)